MSLDSPLLSSAFEPDQVRQAWPLPARPRPIVLIGSGDIVRDAHLPAYRKAGFPIAGVFDLNPAVAQARAREFQVDRVFVSLVEAVSLPGVIFDVATPPGAHESVLAQLPDGAVVLIQKPMGNTLEAARRIRELSGQKRLTAAVNFQLRFSPSMLAIRDLIRRGELGEIVDVEVRINVQTPWELFPFLQREPRVEIQIHTVHYLDLIRSFLGNPRRVFARTVQHPRYPQLSSTRSSIILDYGEMIRCCLSVNHCHPFGARQADASIRIEGTDGCAVASLGSLVDYPTGRPDRLEVFPRSAGAWMELPLSGNWFPDGFVGTMANLQRVASGEDAALISPVADGYETMKTVEACYRANASGGIRLDSLV